MITVNELYDLFGGIWFVLEDEKHREVFVERLAEDGVDISDFGKCEVKGAYFDRGITQVVCQIDSNDPNYPKKKRYEFTGTYTCVIYAKDEETARDEFSKTCIEEFDFDFDNIELEVEDVD